MDRDKNSFNTEDNSPKNNPNQQKNIIFIDSSGGIFNNPQKYPLDTCKEKKSICENIITPLINKETNLNAIIEDKLKMKIKKILDEMRKKDNKKSIKENNLINIQNTLDHKNCIVPLNKKDNILKIINDINLSYNHIYSANYSNQSNLNLITPNQTYKSDQIYTPPQKEFPNSYQKPYTLFPRRQPRRTYKKKSFIPSPIDTKPIVFKHVNIDVEINIIKDLLDLCEKYPLKPDIKYNINMKAIHSIQKPLIALDNMIGMSALKSSIIDQIIFFIQNLHKSKEHNDFMHTVVCGPPGTGKTEVAKIMGKIFSNLGILSRNKFKKVTRADMIAGYLGQTAIKTKEVIQNALGGVLFIDEAYSLGNQEKRDSFAKECIDTLCESLSDHKDNLMVIIAGYEEELDKCFFNYNQGLNSRFTWRFKIDDYTPKELKLIFEKKIKEINWELKSENEFPVHWFEKNSSYFTFYGRDMETLLAKTKIAHSKRVFCKSDDQKKKITLNDLENGFKIYLENDEVKKRKDNDIPYNLYT